MRVVILGSTGYIGCRLAEKLSGRHEVICLKLKDDPATSLNGIRDRVSIVDIDDFLVSQDDIDCLINLACRYQKNGFSDYEVFDSNLIAPMKVFSKALELNASRFITIDTALPADVNVYSLAKKKFSEILRWYAERMNAEEQKISIVNVLLENYYGEDEPENRFIPDLLRKLRNNEEILLTEGDQKRDWIYAKDVINALADLTDKEGLPGYLDLPLGSGENVEIRELITYLKEITHSESVLKFGAIPKRMNEPDTCADTSLMKKYGLRITYGWKEGFKKLAEGDR